LIPVNSEALLRILSSMIIVVLICIDMHIICISVKFFALNIAFEVAS
jgi:hypothetical protein